MQIESIEQIRSALDSVDQIKSAYEAYLIDGDANIFCQLAGQALGLPRRAKYGENTRYSVQWRGSSASAEWGVFSTPEEAEACRAGRPDVYIIEKLPGYRDMYEENLRA